MILKICPNLGNIDTIQGEILAKVASTMSVAGRPSQKMLDTEDIIRQDNDRNMNDTELTSTPVNEKDKRNDQHSKIKQLKEETDSQLRSLIDGLTRHTPKQVSSPNLIASFPGSAMTLGSREEWERTFC